MRRLLVGDGVASSSSLGTGVASVRRPVRVESPEGVSSELGGVTRVLRGVLVMRVLSPPPNGVSSMRGVFVTFSVRPPRGVRLSLPRPGSSRDSEPPEGVRVMFFSFFVSRRRSRKLLGVSVAVRVPVPVLLGAMERRETAGASSVAVVASSDGGAADWAYSDPARAMAASRKPVFIFFSSWCVKPLALGCNRYATSCGVQRISLGRAHGRFPGQADPRRRVSELSAVFVFRSDSGKLCPADGCATPAGKLVPAPGLSILRRCAGT